jgi:integrase
MPERFSTRLGYEAWLKNHILPRWGGYVVTALQARPVELWLNTLPVSPKNRVHVRALIRALWEYAMWRADIPTQRNPMEVVTVKNGTKRRRRPRSLTVEEFQKFVGELEEPVRTISGLRLLWPPD